MNEAAIAQPMLEAFGVRKSFGTVEVLKGIDMTVERGQVACIIGPSGGGKSTFLRCINHLEKMNVGRIVSTAGWSATARPATGSTS